MKGVINDIQLDHFLKSLTKVFISGNLKNSKFSNGKVSEVVNNF